MIYPYNDGTILQHRRKIHNAISSVNAWSLSATSYLSRASDYTSNADSKYVLMSFWINVTNSGIFSPIYYTDNSIIYCRAFSNQFVFDMYNSSFVSVLSVANTIIPSYNVWNHVLLSCDMNNASNRALFVNGVSSSPTWTVYDTTLTFDFTRPAHYVFGDGGGSGPNCKFSEFYLSNKHTTYFNPITDISKFRTSSGKPADLGSDGSTPTGVVPLVYIRNPAATITTNLTGYGDFAKSGTITDTNGP